MNQYLLIGLIIILFWLAGFGVYLVVSNKQRKLVGDIDQLAERLEDDQVE